MRPGDQMVVFWRAGKRDAIVRLGASDAKVEWINAKTIGSYRIDEEFVYPRIHAASVEAGDANRYNLVWSDGEFLECDRRGIGGNSEEDAEKGGDINRFHCASIY